VDHATVSSTLSGYLCSTSRSLIRHHIGQTTGRFARTIGKVGAFYLIKNQFVDSGGIS
jgi:hypothetical protein